MSDEMELTRGDDLSETKDAEGNETHENPEIEGAETPPDSGPGDGTGTDETAKPANGRRRKIILIGVSALIVVAIGALIYLLYGRPNQSTDDPFFYGDIVPITPQGAE